MESDSDATTSEKVSVLLQSLAAGVRSVQSLPVDESWDFITSLPTVARPLRQVQENLLRETHGLLVGNERTLEEILEAGAEDPLIWDEAGDACEEWMERVEQQLLKTETVEETLDPELAASVQQSKQQSTDTASSNNRSSFYQPTYDTLPKPQDELKCMRVHNSRTEPFIPAAHPEKPHSVVPLDLSLQPGHGLEDTRLGGTLRTKEIVLALPPDAVIPCQHVPHVYRTELEQFQAHEWQLTTQKPKTTIIELDAAMEDKVQWVDSVEDLEKLAQKQLQSTRYMAVDLEAHSYRSFAGFVCLMQISIRENEQGPIQTFLIDTLTLYQHMNRCLASIFANPNIVKIMHGADSDVVWLQRDFGIFIVNLFDTGRAARALQLPSAGYSHLLHRYAPDVTTDKTMQLADWRVRPLTAHMRKYAAIDTHYLLDIYPLILWDLEQHATASVPQAIDDSRNVSLLRYAGPPLFLPTGFKKLLGTVRKGKKRRRNTVQSNELSTVQECVLAALWDWRDEVAREEDESFPYVASNELLLRLARVMPLSESALRNSSRSVSPLVLQNSVNVISLIRTAKARGEADEEEKDVDGIDDDDMDEECIAAPVPPVSAPRPLLQPNGALSRPILGSEVCKYIDSKWLASVLTEQAETDEDDDEGVLVELHHVNKNYHTSKGHSSLGRGYKRSYLVEGRDYSMSNSRPKKKLKASAGVDTRGCLTTLFKLVEEAANVPIAEKEDEAEEKLGTVEQDEYDGYLEIPRSMREVYPAPKKPTATTKRRPQPSTVKTMTLEDAEQMLESATARPLINK